MSYEPKYKRARDKLQGRGPSQPVSHHDETTGTPDSMVVGNKVDEWVTTVQCHMHVKEEPCECLPRSAIYTIDRSGKNVNKER
jgi:hypothetical protein